jgi:hypothetical protein
VIKLLFLVTLLFISSFANASVSRQIIPEVFDKSCSDVIHDSISFDDDYGWASIYNIKVAPSDLENRIKRVFGIAVIEMDSPRYTENKIFVSESSTESSAKCSVYDIGRDFSLGAREAYSVSGTFSGDVNLIEFKGEGMSCPAPNRGSVAVSATYKLGKAILIQTSLSIGRSDCE